MYIRKGVSWLLVVMMVMSSVPLVQMAISPVGANNLSEKTDIQPLTRDTKSDTTQLTKNTQGGVINADKEFREPERAPERNIWLNKIDPSLRDGANAGSKEMIKVTVLTKNMGVVNSILSKYMSQDIEGKKVSPSLRTDTNSNVPVMRTVTVPYSALRGIASLPGVMGIYKFTSPVPADIDNMVESEAHQRIEEMKAEGGVQPIPMDYTTPVEHHADDAWSMGYSGSGVNVAVVDTGVDFANPDLVGQWAVDNNTNSAYYGWPIMWDPVSMDLLDRYFTADNDWERYPYPIFASYGESSWYSDTTYVAQKNTTNYVNYTYGNNGYWTKRYDPLGYGNGNSDFISRNYYVGNITSASGNFHLGIAKDDHLTEYVGERVGMLVVDSTTPGVYDTVYVDLNNNLDFTDDKPVTKDSPLSYEDLNGDGEPDISGGLLYFISNTLGNESRELIMSETDTIRNQATLSHGGIVTDVSGGMLIQPSDDIYLNQNGSSYYMPSNTEKVYQNLVPDGTGVHAYSTFFLDDTGMDIMGYKSVNFTYLNSNGFGTSSNRLELQYINSSGYIFDMFESDTPGMLNYTFDGTTGAITILFDMENGSKIDAYYWLNSYMIDYSSGLISFISDVPVGINVTADYDYGLPLPYSDTYTERMGYDNFIPASGDLVAFFGDFDYGENHGTLCASSVVGTWTSMTYGTAPAAKIIGIGDFYNAASYDAWYFAVEGYDGVPSTGDEAQIVSNSFASPDVNEDGWDYASRLAYNITAHYAPNATFVVAAGNDGWGYGTVTSPGSAPGVITAGAGTNMAYRWLFGYDGGESGDWMNYYSPDTSWYGDVADFSGRGPSTLGTPDPDVLAVGEFAIGSLPLNDWAVTAGYYGMPVDGLDAWDLWAGTSLATPVTAGVLALIYQSYYDNHNNTWPSGDAAKKILTSSCDDHGYDPLQQGAGWVNASLGVQMAAEMNGVTSDTMYWTPGDYHGQKMDASVHLLDAGASDSTEITFTNHDQGAPATVDISDALYNKTGEYTFNITTNTSDIRIIKPDGVYLADGTQVLSEGMSTEWNNADFMKVTAYTTQTDVAYPYMELYDWMDREHYGGNETAFDSTITAVDNETVITGQYGETYAYISHLPVVPGIEVMFFSNGTKMTNNTDYTFDASTGKITFIDSSSGDPRPLWEGEVISATYSYYIVVSSGDTYTLSNAPITSYTVWFTNENGTIVQWPTGDSNYTLDTTNGIITLNTNLKPGEIVKVEYYWEHAGIYDGKTERIRMNVNMRQANIVTAGIYRPASRIDDGLIWSMKDVNVLYLGASPVNISFKVTVEFYQKADWSWLTTNVTTLNIPAGGTAKITASITVPADAAIGAYEGSIVYDLAGHVSIIPVLVNVPATAFPVHFGGNVPTTSLYENGAGMGGYNGGASGDWRFYFVDVDNFTVETGRKVFMMDYWDGMYDDMEMYLFSAEMDPYGFTGGQYGNFSMVQVAGTADVVGVTDTVVPFSEILPIGMMTSGPFEIAVRGVTITGTNITNNFHGELGYMDTSPVNISIYTNELLANETEGHPYPVTVDSNIDLTDGLTLETLRSVTREWNGQPVDPYPYSGGPFEAYLANAPNEVVVDIAEHTVSATFSMYFYNGANDVDMGIFYDANGDGIATAGELAVSIYITATLANPEVATIKDPSAGVYIIKAAGYDVSDGSLFDLTVTTKEIAETNFFAVNLPNTTIPAYATTQFGIGWDFRDAPPSSEVNTLCYISPGCAPYALLQPINITFVYDNTPPMVLATTPENNSYDVSFGQSIVIDFSEPINISTLEYSCTPNPGGWIETWSNGNKTVSLSHADFGEGTYTLLINRAEDRAANNLEKVYYLTFCTNDTTAPVHSNEYPASGGSTSDTTPTISVMVTDNCGVNGSSIRLYVQGYSVFYTLSDVTNGYNVSYTQETAFSIGDLIACRIVARDFSGNLLDYNWTFSIVSPDTSYFNIPVHLGWNLISYPLITSGDIEIILNDDVVWDNAQWYNPTDTGDHWKTYVVGRALNDLSNIDNTMAIWLHVTAIGDGNLTVSGNAPSSTVITLSAGWNLVSYPSSVSSVMSAAGLPPQVIKIAHSDSAATYLVSEVVDRSANSFSPGNGYWLYSTADTTWTVNY